MIQSPKTVQRYRELKEQVPDCLLLMQVGAFMQVMDADARGSKETGRRVTRINERALVLRWPGTSNPLPLAISSNACLPLTRRSSHEV